MDSDALSTKKILDIIAQEINNRRNHENKDLLKERRKAIKVKRNFLDDDSDRFNRIENLIYHHIEPLVIPKGKKIH